MSDGDASLPGEDRLRLQALCKLEAFLRIRRILLTQCPHPRTVSRRRNLSSAEFLGGYYSQNQPVVFFDLCSSYADEPRWEFAQLEAGFGAEMVEIMTRRKSDPLYERNYDAHRERIRFSDYLKLLRKSEATNDHYLVANNHIFNQSAFLSLIEDFPFPSFLDRKFLQGRSFLWLGPAGTVTPMHHDSCNILLVQIRGRKLVKLASPEFTPCMYNSFSCFSDVDPDKWRPSEQPRFAEVDLLEVVLQPGEALFLPVGWWHSVRALDSSISLSFSNFAYINEFDIPVPKP